MNWRMWMAISGFVMVVLALVAAASEWLGGGEYYDIWGNIGGPLADFATTGVIGPIAAIVFAVSWFMDRSSA